jgi:hypothetical protein
MSRTVRWIVIVVLACIALWITFWVLAWLFGGGYSTHG